jgi:hypothetical protein
MNKTTKTVLIIIGSLLVLCACTSAVLLGTGLWSFGKVIEFADNSTTEDPQEVSRIASKIADFDIPEDYSRQYGMEIDTFNLVQYANNGEDTYIFLAQFPADTSINPDQLMREIKNSSRNPNHPLYNTDMQIVEQKPVTIRGEETTLTISEGTSDQGELYRMANAKFQGNGSGPALLMIVGPADGWDAQMVEDFVASIR